MVRRCFGEAGDAIAGARGAWRILVAASAAAVMFVGAAGDLAVAQEADQNCLPPGPNVPNYAQALQEFRERAASMPRAPAGYHYEYGSCTPTPNDACMRAELTTPGALQNVNASVGRPNGVASKVSSMHDLRSVDFGALNYWGIRPANDGNAMSCHATMDYENGRSESGIVSFVDPGQYAQIRVSWIPDHQIAATVAERERLATAPNLNVKPDLHSPAIQQCVGAKVALGAQEQFPGQYWAACAYELTGTP